MPDNPSLTKYIFGICGSDISDQPHSERDGQLFIWNQTLCTADAWSVGAIDSCIFVVGGFGHCVLPEVASFKIGHKYRQNQLKICTDVHRKIPKQVVYYYSYLLLFLKKTKLHTFNITGHYNTKHLLFETCTVYSTKRNNLQYVGASIKPRSKEGQFDWMAKNNNIYYANLTILPQVDTGAFYT